MGIPRVTLQKRSLKRYTRNAGIVWLVIFANVLEIIALFVEILVIISKILTLHRWLIVRKILLHTYVHQTVRNILIDSVPDQSFMRYRTVKYVKNNETITAYIGKEHGQMQCSRQLLFQKGEGRLRCITNVLVSVKGGNSGWSW